VARRSSEHQQILKRRHRLAAGQLQSRRCGIANHRFGIDPLVRRGSRSSASRIEPDNAEPSLRLERLGDVFQKRHRVVDLAIDVHDQHGVDARRQAGIFRRAEHGAHVPQPLPLHTATDDFDHLWLNILRVHDPVRSHTARQANGKPSAAGAEVGHHRSFGDLQRIHDQVRFLPQITIGRIEQAEVLRGEEAALRLLRLRRRGLGR
jgi:hypothetical protein